MRGKYFQTKALFEGLAVSLSALHLYPCLHPRNSFVTREQPRFHLLDDRFRFRDLDSMGCFS